MINIQQRLLIGVVTFFLAGLCYAEQSEAMSMLLQAIERFFIPDQVQEAIDLDLTTFNQGDVDRVFKAAIDGNTEEVKRFLLKGNVDVQNECKQSLLHVVAIIGKSSHKKIARILLEASADFDTQDTTGKTPLHNAAWCENEEIAEMLIAAGASLDVQGDEGDTPSHCAVTSENNKLVALLTEAGANLSLENEDGKSALDLASPEIKEIIDASLKKVEERKKKFLAEAQERYNCLYDFLPRAVIESIIFGYLQEDFRDNLARKMLEKS
jgi:ankyrin repeat protein